jgi:nicotinamidase-related amidase
LTNSDIPEEIMSTISFGERARPFLEWLDGWRKGLERRYLAEVFPAPDRAAIMSVDLINGFCYEGPLASPRVAGVVPAVVALFEKAHASGVGHFVLFQDTHSDVAPEFGAFGPHCVAGTSQADTVPELEELPFSGRFLIIEKNSISSAIGTDLDRWLRANGGIDSFVVVGDCTDLCVYQLAMHLKLTANAANIERTVIVPADCVNTYDMPVDRAGELGVLPHDGDLLHSLFLYHMALNGIYVIAGIG